MSGLKKIQRIDLLFYLYEIYKTDNIGDFNEFLRWANTAIQTPKAKNCHKELKVEAVVITSESMGLDVF